MASLKKLSMATAAFIAVSYLIPGKVFAVSIVSQISGSPNPPVITGSSLQNGGFLITPNVFQTLGDGVDEFTNWKFDFNTDPNVESFSNSGSLTSAILTLTLSPKSLFDTDTTALADISKGFYPFEIPGVPQVGQTGTITVDLLKPPDNTFTAFTSQEILEVFNSKGKIISWGYQDDAIISFAKLELKTEDVKVAPEPSSALSLLAFFGAFGVCTLLKRKTC